LFPQLPGRGMVSMAWLLMSICYLPPLPFYRRDWFLAPLFWWRSSMQVQCCTSRSRIGAARGEWKGRVQDA
jgi:hypothetical protein